MNAQRCIATNVLAHCSNNFAYFTWQRTAVGVAQHQVCCTFHDGCFQNAQRELLVVFKTVEEVLHVNKNALAIALQKLHRVGNHGNAFFKSGLQCVFYVVVPALCHNAHRRSLRFNEVAQRVVVVNFAARATRRTKCHQHRVGKLQFAARTSKEFDVFGVRTWPAAFNEVHA